MHKHHGTHQKKHGNCKACVKLRQLENPPFDCSRCYELKGEEAFAPRQRSAHSAKTRVCVGCVETRKCIACKLHRQRDAFSQGELVYAERKCTRSM